MHKQQRLYAAASVLAWLVVNLYAITTATATSDSEAFFISSAVRTIDLASSISSTRISSSLIATNIANGDSAHFYFAVDNVALQNGTLSYIGVEQKVGQKKVPLEFVPDSVDEKSNAQIYKATLASPVAKDETTTIYLKEVYSTIVEPYPREQVQTKSQLVKYSGNVYLLSPYKIETLKSIVKVKTADLQDATTYESKTIDKLNYGPFKDIPPFSFSPLLVHWMKNSPILKFKTLLRHVELSHWGNNIWVQENYDLHHIGAKLKGHFSRVDFQFTIHQHHQTNVLKELKFTLPPRASEVYFKDQIGNVSTSHFRNERTKSILELKPRYPIYGGWHYAWFHGYYVPLSDFLKFNKKEQRYLLQIPFVSSLPDVPIEQVVVKVVLPEGASDVQVKTPFKLDSEKRSLHYAYFDTTGRPTVILEKSNVVEEHFAPIQITYSYSTIRLLQKPVVVSVVILGLLLVSMIYARLDISITADQVAERDAILRTHRTAVVEILKNALSVFRHLEDITSEFKARRQLDQFKTKRQELENQMAVNEKELEEILKKVEIPKDSATTPLLQEQQGLEKAFVKDVREVLKQLKLRLAKQKSKQNLVVGFLTDTDTGDADEMKKDTYTENVKKLDAEIVEIDKNIRKTLSELQQK